MQFCFVYMIDFVLIYDFKQLTQLNTMRKQDLINQIADKTGIPKVDVLVTLETMFKEVKYSLIKGESIYIRGFGSFYPKKRAAKIGRNIKKMWQLISQNILFLRLNQQKNLLLK